ncbi:nitrilase [Colletotrichum liriopes]|uniref:Nitrilase n=1 Tax=Colletotrichum liriopes TaxID=708192 RepID=A0AA37H0X0_9PEZI|nr:nitrilase [Colletotrichum liriopes]
MAQTTRVAACHAAPVFLSARETTAKAVDLIKQASAHGANLVVFPETFIAAFPIWSALRAPTENHEFFKRMALESVYVDGDEINAVRAAAKASGVIVSIGFSEKVRYSSATLFNSNLLIDEQGKVLVHHRKLVATFFEKLTWAPGDGHGLQVAETKHGKIGALICGENTNPLARFALMAQGEQIHLSTWPAVWPTRLPKDTAAHGKANYDNITANRTRAAAHCFEAKCFGVLCAGVLGEDAIQAIADGAPHLKELLEQAQRGATMFLDPTGAPLPSFVIGEDTHEMEKVDCLQKTEGILYADMNLEDCIEGKQYHDVVGGYQRMDVFQFAVNRTRQSPATFSDLPVPDSFGVGDD